MTHEELKDRTVRFLGEMLRIESAEEKVCECGEIILNPEKSMEALDLIMHTVMSCTLSILESDGPGARLHAPAAESDKPPVRFH